MSPHPPTHPPRDNNCTLALEVDTDTTQTACSPMYEQLKSFHCVQNVMFKINFYCAFALLCELCDLDTCSLDRVCIKMPWDCCLSVRGGWWSVCLQL